MVWRHEARVTARYTFPLDMLRYDRCTPLSQSDVGELELALAGSGRILDVVTFTSDRCAPWTIDRWKSFGCTVEHLSSRRGW